MKQTVSIIQTRLTHYRVPLFQKLRESLDNCDINLNLIHGHAKGPEAKRNDDGYLDWAIQVDNLSLKLCGSELLWQPALKYLNNSDLIVVTQENRILLNYFLLARKHLNHQKIAFWGHGKNFQIANPSHPKELFKRFFLNKPDWWFAYTALTEKILLNAQYPASKITVLNNAIDTSEISFFAKSITEEKLCSLRNDLGITGKHVGIFCGSLYAGKKIAILIAAAQQIRAKINDFQLVVIGAGPDEYLVKEAAKTLPWIHHVGPCFGYEKALFMKLGQVFLLPYMAGLAILDSFTLGIPVVTMIDGNHGPEIAYLRSEKNGIITGNSIGDYANAICTLFNNQEKHSAIVNQCLADAKLYTIENMVNNFAKGILACLDEQ
jgi:glycosyltransferase involved in cell wall biosynthesis